MPKVKAQKRITVKEARKLYPDEWVIFGEPKIDEKTTTFIDGIVYHHCQDRERAFEVAKEIQGTIAVEFTGDPNYRKVRLKVDEVGKAAA